jgi:hypothetical protein
METVISKKADLGICSGSKPKLRIFDFDEAATVPSPGSGHTLILIKL